MNNAEKIIVRRWVGTDALSQVAALGSWIGAIAARRPRRNPGAGNDDWMRDYPELVWATDNEIRQFAARQGRPHHPEHLATATYIRRF